MTTHIHCTPDSVCWGFLDASSRDVAEVRCGEGVRIDTVSGNRARVPADRSRFQVLPEHLQILDECAPRLGPHILTGPVHVLGAQPGQLLSVRIDSIALRQNWGWNEIVAGGGAIPELEGIAETVTIPIDVDTGTIALPWGVNAPAAPFFGILAVKPRPAQGALTSVVPDYFGGNMDIRQLRSGAEVFFPIQCAGAGFFAGDGHALQGDGEIVGTAVETALTGVFTFGLLENHVEAKFPFALLPDRLVTMSFSEHLDIATEVAIRQAVRTLAILWKLGERDAYRHCSLLGNLSISQIVNVKKSVHFSISTAGLTRR